MESCLKNNHSHNEPLSGKIITLLILLFTSIVVSSQVVEIGGILPDDRTFYSDTTYIIVQDVTVNNKNTLTIEPGTIIKVNFGRSLIIDDASLYVLGDIADSVVFKPNYTVPFQTWKWNGIIVKNSDYESPTSLKYTRLVNCETALEIDNSVNTRIENSTILNSQNIGVNIINSSFCSVINTDVLSNYNGIEFYTSTEGTTSNNIITNCKLKNQNHNIYSFIENFGNFNSNVISGNLIAEGNNGIWMDNAGNASNAGNSIMKNLFISNGGFVGYGLFLAMDSTSVVSNIFYDNTVAVFSESKGRYCNIINNSFYKNIRTIEIGSGSTGNIIVDNTFSENTIETLGLKDVTNTSFTSNNLMNTKELFDIVINSTANNINVFNNYWGTLSETKISELIYDYYDDPSLGIMYFVPFLDSMIVRNPISPPYRAVKQQVDNKVKVTFKSNTEYDLGGYFVYFGNYSDYSFQNRVDIGLDTSVYITEDISIFDELAVTAHDTSAFSSSSMINGNESPFAFAKLYPYSGEDTLVCKFVGSFSIERSTVPMQFENLFWTTSGDGLYNDNAALHPEYFPGPGDIENGGVILTLNVITAIDTLADSFFLRINDDPVAFAGNDTIVVADTGVYMIEAKALNYSNINWTTEGDGFFDTDSIVNPVYFPGPEDINIGAVTLIMHVNSECGSASDSVTLTIEPHFSLEGQVWSSVNDNANAVVIAYQDGAEVIARTFVLTNSGKFRFPKLMRGDYYIYALPDTTIKQDYLPGYYVDKLKWEAAYSIEVNADVYDIDITLPPKQFVLPDGLGTIKGKVDIPSFGYVQNLVNCESWYEVSNSTMCNGGLSNIVMILSTSDMSKSMEFAISDSLGNFYFNGLPYGNYRLRAELAGFKSIPSGIISVTTENSYIEGLQTVISGNEIMVMYTGNFGKVNSVDVFPNPSNNYLSVKIPSGSDDMCVKVYNRNALEVSHKISVIGIDNKSLNLDISDLEIGIYFGIITTSESTYKLKFLKQ